MNYLTAVSRCIIENIQFLTNPSSSHMHEREIYITYGQLPSPRIFWSLLVNTFHLPFRLAQGNQET